MNSAGQVIFIPPPPPIFLPPPPPPPPVDAFSITNDYYMNTTPVQQRGVMLTPAQMQYGQQQMMMQQNGALPSQVAQQLRSGGKIIGEIPVSGLSGDRILFTNPIIYPGRSDASDETAEALQTFEIRNRALVGHISVQDVSWEELAEGVGENMVRGAFMSLSPDDTKQYADVIETALDAIPQGELRNIIDLGAGSSIPTIRALARTGKYDRIKVTSVEIDPQAVLTSIANIRSSGLADRYMVVMDNMTHFLGRTHIRPGDFFVSNPPYIPCPAGLFDPMFVPVNGGPDGARYLKQLLLSPMPSGNYVGLRWSSLSNPREMINIIDNYYDVVHLDAFTTPFGFYTSRLRGYLEIQRALGLAYYFKGENGEDSYTYYSIILRRKGGYGIHRAGSRIRSHEMISAGQRGVEVELPAPVNISPPEVTTLPNEIITDSEEPITSVNDTITESDEASIESDEELEFDSEWDYVNYFEAFFPYLDFYWEPTPI